MADPARVQRLPDPMAKLFARAKGPRRFVTCTEVVPCPWCGEDAGEAVEALEAETACPECGKEFTVKGEGGNLVCVGLLSPADMKYQAERAALANAPAAAKGEG